MQGDIITFASLKYYHSSEIRFCPVMAIRPSLLNRYWSSSVLGTAFRVVTDL